MSTAATFTLEHRPDLALLLARWPTELSEPAQHRAEYARLLTEGQDCACWHWLLDVRRRPMHSTVMAEWIVTHWLPDSVVAVAPKRLRLAYLVSPPRLLAIEHEAALRSMVAIATDAARPYTLAVFSDEGEAMRWLAAA